MSFKKKLRSIFPPTNRNFERRMKVLENEMRSNAEKRDRFQEIIDKQDECLRHLQSIQAEAESSAVLRAELQEKMLHEFQCVKNQTTNNEAISRQLLDSLRIHDAHMKMFAWASYRKSGETLEAAKARFFLDLPQAAGNLRILQKGCARILGEFDRICRDNGFEYWIDCGTLLGAFRHEGFIPWDDDLDVGMMRPTVDEFLEFMRGNERFQVTTVYGRFVHSRELRFKLLDEDVPCFLDIFIYDFEDDRPKEEIALQRRAEHEELAVELEDYNAAHDNCWDKCPRLGVGNEGYEGIGAIYKKADAECRIRNNESTRQKISWGIDNLYINSKTWMVHNASSIFPLSELEFEGMSLLAPSNPSAVLRELYGDYWELPNDIHNHSHIDADEAGSNLNIDAIQRFLEQG